MPDINPLLKSVIEARCRSEEEAKEMLSPCEILHDPYLFSDMEKAVERITAALSQGETICVYGDYDCDGVCATVILIDYLQNIGGKAFYYIPNREKEGYGLNKNAIDFIKKMGASLIITVDNGIAAIDEIDYAGEMGMETIVTDHHTPREELPNAVANINPHIKNCGYPFPGLCGAAVAFKLVCAIEGEKGFGLLEQYGDLLAIATIGDIVELRNENRFFVQKGIENIKENCRLGISCLFNTAGVEISNDLTSETIAFTICPRVNAAGRMETADYAVMLFLSEEESEAQELAKKLNDFNDRRKEDEKRIFDDIRMKLMQNPPFLHDRIAVIDGEGWNSGVIGIVASRICERLKKPVLIVAKDEENAKGSGRSVEDFSLIQAVSACSEPLLFFGGHPMAAGFSLKSENIGEFAKLLNEYEKTVNVPLSYLTVDSIIEPYYLNTENVESLSLLSPYGSGNPQPVFAMEQVKLVKALPLSGGRHTKYEIEKNNISYNLLCFNMLYDERELLEGETADIAFTVSLNNWRGKNEIVLNLISMKLSGKNYEQCEKDSVTYSRLLDKSCDKIAECPKREETAMVYKLIRSFKIRAHQLENEYQRYVDSINISYLKFLLSVDILQELGTIRENERGCYEIIGNAKKTDFYSSLTVRRLS